MRRRFRKFFAVCLLVALIGVPLSMPASAHTGWHQTSYYRCISNGELQQLWAYLAATSSGGHTATAVPQQWWHAGWCW